MISGWNDYSCSLHSPQPPPLNKGKEKWSNLGEDGSVWDHSLICILYNLWAPWANDLCKSNPWSFKKIMKRRLTLYFGRHSFLAEGRGAACWCRHPRWISGYAHSDRDTTCRWCHFILFSILNWDHMEFGQESMTIEELCGIRESLSQWILLFPPTTTTTTGQGQREMVKSRWRWFLDHFLIAFLTISETH